MIAFFTARDDATTDSSAVRGEPPGVAAAPPEGIADLGRRGNVIIELPARSDGGPAVSAAEQDALEAVARDVAGDPYFTPELRRAGQAIEIRATASVQRIVAYAWQRRYETDDPRDPRLREFVDYWLGRAA